MELQQHVLGIFAGSVNKHNTRTRQSAQESLVVGTDLVLVRELVLGTVVKEVHHLHEHAPRAAECCEHLMLARAPRVVFSREDVSILTS